MLIETDYFVDDKNYVLKTVQAFNKHQLIGDWTTQILQAYNRQHNPMGLVDDFILELQEQISVGAELLDEAYDIVAAAYRFSHHDQIMQLDWNARSEMEQYTSDWKVIFKSWIIQLSTIPEIQRAVIKYATQGKSINSQFLKTGIRRAVLRYFKLRMRSKRLYRMSA